MSEPHLKHKDELLRQIAEQLKKTEFQRVSVANIKVTFVASNGEFTFSLQEALNCIACDLYWNELGNYSNATKAKVETF